MTFTSFGTYKSKQRRVRHRPLGIDELERREVLATLMVTSIADSGAGTLRDAVDQADLMPGPDVIEFDSTLNGQTIQLDSDIIIRDGLSIVGPGSDQLTIDAQELSRHFRVSFITQGDVEFSGLTLVNGRSTGAGGSIASLLNPPNTMRLTDLVMSNNATNGTNAVGGAVYSVAPLEIRDSVITGNSTDGVNSAGGAVSGAFEITISDSQISNNKTLGLSSPGGGVGSTSSAIYVYDSQISGNATYGYYSAGGGVYTQVGGYFQRTTVSGNTTHGYGARGGGLVGYGAALIDSTVSNNATYGLKSPGGGVFSWAYLDVSQSTVSSNKTYDLASSGGGIFVDGFANLSRATVTGNQTETYGTGGGIFADGLLTIDGSIVASNSTGAASQDVDTYSSILLTNSLIGTNRLTSLSEAPVGSPDPDGNLIGDPNGMGVIDPMLGPLQNNGGRTSTQRLLPDSPAIDAGSLSPPAFFDQRGTPFARFRNGGPDMGAYEVQALPGHLGDGIYDCDDIDTIVAQIASGVFDPQLDFTGDGVLNLDDVEAWLAEAGEANLGPGRAYLFGDANLDSFVDGVDFLAWNANKFTATAAWCSGDFNADGFVDGLDFIVWNTNKFQNAAARKPSSTAATRVTDITRSPNLPEPAFAKTAKTPHVRASFTPRPTDDGVVMRAAPKAVRFSSFEVADEVFKRQEWL